MTWHRYISGTWMMIQTVAAAFGVLFVSMWAAGPFSWDIALAYTAQLVFYWIAVPAIVLFVWRSYKYRQYEQEQRRRL